MLCLSVVIQFQMNEIFIFPVKKKRGGLIITWRLNLRLDSAEACICVSFLLFFFLLEKSVSHACALSTNSMHCSRDPQTSFFSKTFIKNDPTALFTYLNNFLWLVWIKERRKCEGFIFTLFGLQREKKGKLYVFYLCALNNNEKNIRTLVISLKY